MLVMENDLTDLTGGVFEAFLGLAAEPTAPEDRAPGPVYTSSVGISGGWDGSVSLIIPEGLARTAAAAMFGMGVDELGPDEVTDAVGELANIIGGNVKGLIEEPCSLSLPMVASGSDYSISVPGTTPVRLVALSCEGQTFHVSVHKRTS